MVAIHLLSILRGPPFHSLASNAPNSLLIKPLAREKCDLHPNDGRNTVEDYFMESMSPAISKLQAILAAKHDWKGIDDLVEACEKASFFDSRFRHEAEGRAKKTYVRRLIATLKDEEGFPPLRFNHCLG
jgi:hypothetical protein